jgi:hypothetical protein
VLQAWLGGLSPCELSWDVAARNTSYSCALHSGDGTVLPHAAAAHTLGALGIVELMPTAYTRLGTQCSGSWCGGLLCVHVYVHVHACAVPMHVSQGTYVCARADAASHHRAC